MTRAGVGAPALLVVAALLLAGCGGDPEGSDDDTAGRSGESGSGVFGRPDPGSDDGPGGGSEGPAVDDADLDLALSEPREDSLYPDVGDPGVDALHYDLDLDWDPETDTLTGEETVTFRSTASAPEFRLDLGEPLEIDALTLDGEEVEWAKVGKDLVVTADVETDQRYVLELSYAGTPAPVPVPTTRGDFSETGFTITDDHETWTMQEPWGAFTWYAVNDHPSDKALYDFELSVPSPWTGVANGELTSREDEDGVTTTSYHLAEPAASYLTTLAFGDYEMTEDESSTGTPITYWIPRDQPELLEGPSTTPEALDWLEERLGPYPFDTAGILVVDSESGMETQTMITLGDTDYSTSPAVVVHELAHQWYGDQVTPDDWRDVWMNEGMAMYLQLMWEGEQAGVDIDTVMDSYAPYEADERASAGPPGDYDPDMFGSSNIYFSGAFMWDELRKMVGDDEAFFEIVRGWPLASDNTSTDREALLAYLEDASGLELDDFYDAWLLSPRTPPTT